jgi:SnoaL-like protein
MEANADALRRGYDALNRKDLSDVFGLIGADFAWESGNGERGRGAESFERFLRSWLDSFQEFRIEPEEVIERGEHLVASVRQPDAAAPAASRSPSGLPTYGRSPTAAPSASAVPIAERPSPRSRIGERRLCGSGCLAIPTPVWKLIGDEPATVFSY